MNLSARLLLLTCLGVVCTPAIAQKIPLGSPAPNVGDAKSVQGKPLSGFERGKVYVLEFWATWCGSCRVAMPHLDEMAAKFADKPVEFYSVSDQQSSQVEAFLKRFPMRTNVVAGANSLFKSFDVHIIPYTVLIDKAGRVAAITEPKAVTASVLNALLEDHKIDLPLANNKPASLDWDKEIVAESVGHVLLRYSDSAGGGSRFVPNSGQITADGAALPALFQLANNVETTDLRWDAPKDDVRYRLSVKAADGKDATARAMLNDTLARTFDLQAQWQDVEREVYVLRAKGAVTLKPSTGPSHEGYANSGGIVWPDASSKDLAGLLGSYTVGKTVIDETNLTGRYALALQWTPGDRVGAIKALSDIGLELTKETRKVKTLMVSPRMLK